MKRRQGTEIETLCRKDLIESLYDHRFAAIAIFFCFKPYVQYLLLIIRTRSQLENLSKDELIDEVLSLENFKNNINSKFSELDDRFINFEPKYEMVKSNLSILRRCNELLLQRITRLERNNFIINITEEKLFKLIQCSLILPIMSWNNLCAKRYP